ncbi:SAVED domain-containing protein [Aureispira sp. CCB-QB1]|uniref:SAVED domain-containing protein n=1 Tax=Aureispira sp. CCB-QB1 TaxID=1313421 RepID=UPI0007C7B5B6|nr:SAVED domain-containing protein [Aureispira sp. CCB-QB1]
MKKKTKKEKSSRPTIPNKIYNLLWAKAAGRCYICNKILYQDLLTNKHVNSAYVAHIYDVNHKTHRYDEDLSPKLSKDISNLMLLCDTHHRMIDNEAQKEYPASRLLKIKKEHEERIKRLTSITTDQQSFMIFYSAPIGKRLFQINMQEAENAMIRDEVYPAEDMPIILSVSDDEARDSETSYWHYHSQNLIRKYKRLIAEKVTQKEITQVSVFAIAPQPLLILLGVLLGDIKKTSIYPKNREGVSWGWRTKTKENQYQIIPPKDTTRKHIVLKISISADIHSDRITNVLGGDSSIWELRISNCNNDFLKSSHQARHFREAVKQLLNQVKHIHGEEVILHLFTAMPAALAIEFGKVYMPKADLPIIIYDQNRDRSGFFETLRIPDCYTSL